MSNKILHVTDDSFDKDVLQSDKLTLVDFWAEWCRPCLAVAPVLEQVASEYEGKVNILKMNVDENTITPSNYGVRGIPTIIAFKNGQEVDRIVGMGPKNLYTDLIERNLGV